MVEEIGLMSCIAETDGVGELSGLIIDGEWVVGFCLGFCFGFGLVR